MATGFMLASEMFNTTVEALCDFMEPQKNEKIAIIKDISAAAAGISILVWWVIIGLEAIHVLQYTGYLPSCFS
ncbi:Diacylglycerol kinase [Candidatus Electrothrix aarhusensis]